MYFEGGIANELFLIKSGKVRLTKKFNERNDEIMVGTLGEGEFFGLVAAMEKSEHTETAIVLEDAEIYVLKPADLSDFITKSLRLGFKLFSSLSNTLREHNSTIEKMAFKESDVTTGEKIFEIAEYYYNSNQPKLALYVYRKYLELYPEGKLVAEIQQQRLPSLQGG